MKINVIVVGEQLSEKDIESLSENWDGIEIHNIHPDQFNDAFTLPKGLMTLSKGTFNILVISQVVNRNFMKKILTRLDYLQSFLTLIVRNLEGKLSQAFINDEGGVSITESLK